MKKYKIPELLFATRDCLATVSLSEEDVPAVAGDPIKYLKTFDKEAKQLLLLCAMYLKRQSRPPAPLVCGLLPPLTLVHQTSS